MDKMFILVITFLMSLPCFASPKTNSINLENQTEVQIRNGEVMELDDETAMNLINMTDSEGAQAYVQYVANDSFSVPPGEVLSRTPHAGWEQLSFFSGKYGTLIFWIRPGYTCSPNYGSFDCRRK